MLTLDADFTLFWYKFGTIAQVSKLIMTLYRNWTNQCFSENIFCFSLSVDISPHGDPQPEASYTNIYISDSVFVYHSISGYSLAFEACFKLPATCTWTQAAKASLGRQRHTFKPRPWWTATTRRMENSVFSPGREDMGNTLFPTEICI